MSTSYTPALKVRVAYTKMVSYSLRSLIGSPFPNMTPSFLD